MKFSLALLVGSLIYVQQTHEQSTNLQNYSPSVRFNPYEIRKIAISCGP